MEYLKVFANAKINLALDVIDKRPDGYHNLNTIMQTISLRDSIELRKIFTPQIKLSTNIKWLHNDERNLAFRAAKALFDKFSPDRGVYIEIVKNIPISAGLGGGSADCAAVLLALVKMFSFPISQKELFDIGLSLGADVPFCLLRQTAQAQGVGEILTPLNPCPDTFIAVVKPPVGVSTAAVFKQFRQENVSARPDIAKIIDAINSGQIKEVANGLCNVLESVTTLEFPIINKIKEIMLAQNALGACMSGSGPSVFGMFEHRQDAYEAITQIKSELLVKDVHLTNIYNPGR